MAPDLSTIWSELNERQRAYLLAVYAVDQRREQHEKSAFNRGRRARKADEWRWMNYHPIGLQDRSELQREIGDDLIDEGTGSSFDALERRKLIECRYQHPSRNYTVLYIKMTTLGRKVIRAANTELQPASKPKGALSRSTWSALKAAVEAGDEGIEQTMTGLSDYGGFTWYGVWVHLYRQGWVTEKSYERALIATEAGHKVYAERLKLHRQLYPDLYCVLD